MFRDSFLAILPSKEWHLNQGDWSVHPVAEDQKDKSAPALDLNAYASHRKNSRPACPFALMKSLIHSIIAQRVNVWCKHRHRLICYGAHQYDCRQRHHLVVRVTRVHVQARVNQHRHQSHIRWQAYPVRVFLERRVIHASSAENQYCPNPDAVHRAAWQTR